MNELGCSTWSGVCKPRLRHTVAAAGYLLFAAGAMASPSCPASLVQTFATGGESLRLYIREGSAAFSTLREDLMFQPGLVIPQAPDGTPQCVVDEERVVDARLTPLPLGCVEQECEGLRIELEVNDSTKIPPTAALVDCQAREIPVPEQPPFGCSYEVMCADAAAADAEGTAVAVACDGGFVLLASPIPLVQATLSPSASRVMVGEEIEISVSAPGANLAYYALLGHEGFLEGTDAQSGGYSTVFRLTAVRGGSVSLRAHVGYEYGRRCRGSQWFVFGSAVSNSVALEIEERPGTARLVVDIVDAPAEFPNTTALTTTIGTTLTSAETSVARVSNELRPASGLIISAGADGSPDCTVQDGVAVDEAQFEFIPPGCVAGVDCEGVRALLRSADPPLPAGIALYRCRVGEVPALGSSCRYRVACSSAQAVDGNGVPLTTDCIDGEVRFKRAIDPIPITVDAPRTATVGDDIIVRVETDPAVPFVQNVSLSGVNLGVAPLLEGNDRVQTLATEAVFLLRATRVGLARVQAVALQLRACGCLNDTFTSCAEGRSQTWSINICGAEEPVVCAGDCDGGGAVTVDELVTGVNLVLGLVSADACPVFDSSDDDEVTVDELIAAVDAALLGCGAG